MDDLGWLGQKAWHLGDCRLEVAGADVGFTGRRVPERSTRKYTAGSSVLRDHSKLMVPGSARVAAELTEIASP